LNKKYHDKAKVSLWMSKEDKQALLNQKQQDPDLSLNVFLMRVLRKYIIQPSQKEQRELEEVMGVKGSAGHHASNPTNTTSTDLSPTSIGVPKTATGGSKSKW